MGVLERNQLSATMDMIHGSARIYDQFMIFANISIIRNNYQLFYRMFRSNMDDARR